MKTDAFVSATAPPPAPGMDPEEWRVRIDLAACYRLFNHFGWTDLIFNHISVCVPGQHDQFLINAFGLMYDEVTASNLVKVDVDGNVISDVTGMVVLPGGFTIHSAVHMVRRDAKCVMHTHTPATIAVSAMERGLMRLSQHAMRFTNRVAYHNYDGAFFNDEERRRLQANLGDKMVMFLRNHGSLVCGKSIEEAFDTMYYLERACQAQVTMLSTGEKLVEPQLSVGDQVAGMFESPGRKKKGGVQIWPAMMRLLDRTDQSYKT